MLIYDNLAFPFCRSGRLGTELQPTSGRRKAGNSKKPRPELEGSRRSAQFITTNARDRAAAAERGTSRSGRNPLFFLIPFSLREHHGRKIRPPRPVSAGHGNNLDFE